MAVPVKKSRKPAPPVKYLLSGDRKLQRLSLKKISDPTKTKPRARTTRGKPAADETPGSPTPPKPIAGRLVIVGTVCLFAAAALLAARQPPPSPLRGSGGAGAPPEAHVLSQPSGMTANSDPNTTATAGLKRSSTSAARPTPASFSIERTSASVPVKTARTAKAATSGSAASTTAVPESTAPVKSPASLTVEGCLESDGPTYRLKNTTGLDAPKARTWRTGFLMKRSSTIGLVDTTGRLRLQDHIGKRVAATGSVVDREMRATTLREVAGSCR